MKEPADEFPWKYADFQGPLNPGDLGDFVTFHNRASVSNFLKIPHWKETHFFFKLFDYNLV